MASDNPTKNHRVTEKEARQVVYYANAWCDEYSAERPYRAKDFVELVRANKRLRELVRQALPVLDGHVIMAADRPGSLWSRMHAAITEGSRE